MITTTFHPCPLSPSYSTKHVKKESDAGKLSETTLAKISQIADVIPSQWFQYNRCGNEIETLILATQKYSKYDATIEAAQRGLIQLEELG